MSDPGGPWAGGETRGWRGRPLDSNRPGERQPAGGHTPASARFRELRAGFAFYRSRKRKLDPKLRELGQTRAGYARGSQFVYSQHCKTSRDAGVDEAKIRAISHWSVADCYTPLERAVLAYTDALVLEGGRVPEEVFDALRAELSDAEILELTYTTCLYEMHATMSRALRLEYDDVDERVVEVPVPGADPAGDGASSDVMAVVDPTEG